MTLPEGDQRSATTRSLTKQFRDAYSFLAFASRRAGLLVRLILEIVFAFAGMDLIFHPTLGLVTLTRILAMIFFLEGFAEIFAYTRLRRQPGTGWLLANGITLSFGGVDLDAVALKRCLGDRHSCGNQPHPERHRVSVFLFPK